MEKLIITIYDIVFEPTNENFIKKSYCQLQPFRSKMSYIYIPGSQEQPDPWSSGSRQNPCETASHLAAVAEVTLEQF